MKKELELLHGSIWDKMIFFALPLACSAILQQLFNAADTSVVGRFAGAQALAAVGANGPVINLFVNLFVGLSVGANALLARYIGAGEKEKITRTVHTSILLALGSGLVLMILGFFLATPIHSLLDTPADVQPLAVSYLRIYFLGMPFIMLYNFAAALLRSKGDTKRPLIALSIAGIINVLLNLLFVIVFHLSVTGVALATSISNVFSCCLLLYWLHREEEPYRLQKKHLRIDPAVLKGICIIGVPAGLQGVIFSLSNVIIQSALNQLGSLYLAGNTAALNYEYIAYFIFNAFNSAALTFIAQNYAAGNTERALKSARWAFLLAQISGAAVNCLFILTRSWTVQIFTSDPQVAAIACSRILILLSFEFFNGSIEVLSGILRGFGKSFIPAAITCVGVCGVRTAMVALVHYASDPYIYLMFCYPVSWILTSAALLLSWMYQKRKIRGTDTNVKMQPAWNAG